MTSNGPDAADHPNSNVVDVAIAPTSMRRPQHGVLDTEETACLDELLHEAALRGSALRPPR